MGRGRHVADPNRRSSMTRSSSTPAIEEIEEVGVDELGMSAVARRAGLTTGALYGRYESGGELAADVWTVRIRDRHFALLDRAIAMLVDHDRTHKLKELVAREVAVPGAETVVALNLLGTARRVDELDEVVLSDVRQWVGGAGPRRGDAGRRWCSRWRTCGGCCCTRNPAAAASTGARPCTASSGRSRSRSTNRRIGSSPTRCIGCARRPAIRCKTRSIDAVAAIVSRMGFERATGSRIAGARASRPARSTGATDQGRPARACHRAPARGGSPRPRIPRRDVLCLRSEHDDRSHRRRLPRARLAATGGAFGSRRTSRPGPAPSRRHARPSAGRSRTRLSHEPRRAHPEGTARSRHPRSLRATHAGRSRASPTS